MLLQEHGTRGLRGFPGGADLGIARLDEALFARFVRKRHGRFDLAISCANEFSGAVTLRRFHRIVDLLVACKHEQGRFDGFARRLGDENRGGVRGVGRGRPSLVGGHGHKGCNQQSHRGRATHHLLSIQGIEPDHFFAVVRRS